MHLLPRSAPVATGRGAPSTRAQACHDHLALACALTASRCSVVHAPSHVLLSEARQCLKNKTAKNMEMSQKILQGDEMMGVVHKHMDEALHIIEEHPQGRNVSVEDANHVMEACMLAMSFGYMPSPRPGQILQLTHQGTPNVSPLRSGTAFHHSMQAGICLRFIWQVMLKFMHSLGYSFQHPTLKQCCHRRATVET